MRCSFRTTTRILGWPSPTTRAGVGLATGDIGARRRSRPRNRLLIPMPPRSPRCHKLHPNCVVPADELPNVPHIELGTIANVAKAKIEEAILVVTGG
jgi:hypothetical protein